MTYRSNYRPARRTATARWMTLRYDGTCKVCRRAIPAGETAFYDPSARSVTCHEMSCCEADGLTKEQWHGSPTGGRWVVVRADMRLGGGHVVIRDPGEDMADRWNERNQ